jgi:hypothetical protein
MAKEYFPGETFDFVHNGESFVATIKPDYDHGAPWEETDGHGPVTEWESRDKLPGELILNDDGRNGRKRFYDYAEACRIARRDGWGTLPAPLKVTTDDDGKAPYEKRGGTAESGPYKATDPDDVNRAISAVYAAYRATMTPRQYAAAAARADYENLRQWCADQWQYIGVIVRRAGDCQCCGKSESLWGIESNAGDYIEETAHELADEMAGEE